MVKPPRESRSLSSENSNFNLGLDGGQRQRANDQRKLHRRLLIIDSSNLPDQSQSQSQSESQPTNGQVRRGRVEMTGYERRRHRNRNSHGNGKHLTRSMTTGANDSSPAAPDKTPAQSPDADSILSRLGNLANANEPANDINRQSTRVRHQHARRIEHAPHPDNGPRKRQQDRVDRMDRMDRMDTEAQSANTTMSGSGSANHRRIFQLQRGSETAASSDLANAHDLALLGGIYEPLSLVSTSLSFGLPSSS